MALAALAPLLGSIIAPSAFTAMGMSMPAMLASAIGGGLGGWAATGNPVTGLEDAAGGALASGIGGLFNGATSVAQSAGNAAATGAASGAASGLDSSSLSNLLGSGTASPAAAVAGSGGASPAMAAVDSADPYNSAIAGLNTMGGGDPYNSAIANLNTMGAPQAAAPTLTSAFNGGSDPLAFLRNALGGGAATSAPGAAATTFDGSPLKSLTSYASAHPYITGLGGLMALSALGPKPKTPAEATYTSPGLTPYQNRTTVPTPAGFQPGISPEPYYFSNPAGFADGGPVVANPYQQAAPGMVDLQLGLNPTQIIQKQLSQQALQPAMRYAGGGSIPQLPKPQMSVDNRGMSMLQREAMRSAMPYPHPAQTAPMAHMAMPHAASAHMSAPLGMAMGGGVPGAPGGLGGLPGMQVPDSAGDGSSDSIPATIDGKAPALLSSGEVVTPSDVVSHLGNGSNAAGAKRMQAMNDRVRMAKTGSKKMPARINAAKMLPA